MCGVWAELDQLSVEFIRVFIHADVQERRQRRPKHVALALHEMLKKCLFNAVFFELCEVLGRMRFEF